MASGYLHRQDFHLLERLLASLHEGMKDQTKQPKRLTAEAVHAITSALRDFGYKALTDERVRELSDELLDGSISYPFRTGETPKGGTITRFIAGQLSDAGWLPADK